ncbi:MAG: hypothetical protein JKY42_07290 [Flavobacteriales bacterium]|nr:hypothetical protein [Flavobacteriales bacterium]
MKTILGFIALILLVVASPYNLYTEKWGIDESKTMDGIVITRLSEENTEIGVTNISYETQKKLLHDLKDRVKNDGMSKDRYAKYADRYQRKAAGGRLHVFITRNDFDRGNMDYFEVYIYDKKGHEMFHQRYPNQIPKTNREEIEYMWKNEGLMMITPDLYLPATIEVVDKFQGKEIKHQFKVAAE